MARISELVPFVLRYDPYAPPPGRDVRFADGAARRHAWARSEVSAIEFRCRIVRVGVRASCMATAFVGLGASARSAAQAVTALDSEWEPR